MVSTQSPSRPVRVAVVGTHGFGLSHLRIAGELSERGLVQLVAVADTVPPDPGTLPAGTPEFRSLTDLLAEVDVDVVTIATPIHTHLELARTALQAGADVLLEKPPTASRAEFDELLALTAETGRHCQIGFQSLGSLALPALDALMASGRLGEIRGIGGYGAWLRTTAYWARSAWAGKRRLNGREVSDGVVTNPLAHAVATALRLAGAATVDDVASVGTELYRANDIEADDTSVIDVTTAEGMRVVIGLTLCARDQSPPYVTVHGTTGKATLYYTDDDVVLELDGVAPERTHYARTGLLENLIAHRSDPTVDLLASVEKTGAFIRVLEAVRSAPAPTLIPEQFVQWVDDEAGRHPILQDVEHWMLRASTELRSLRELGAPWATYSDADQG
jgi:predicted dehydrogenase